MCWDIHTPTCIEFLIDSPFTGQLEKHRQSLNIVSKVSAAAPTIDSGRAVDNSNDIYFIQKYIAN